MNEWEAVSGGVISQYAEADDDELGFDMADDITVFEELVDDESKIVPFQLYCEEVGINTPDSDSFREFEDSYAGLWQSFREFADDLADQTILSSEDRESTLARYFDWEMFARDLEYDYFTVDDPDSFRVHVYRNL